jgi:hypothetical protein
VHRACVGFAPLTVGERGSLKDAHVSLIREGRLIAGVNTLGELPPTLRRNALLIKDKVASGSTLEDAEMLAAYGRTLLFGPVSRSTIHGRSCSTIALARLMNWKRRSVSPVEAPSFSSSQNVSSSVPVMPPCYGSLRLCNAIA